MTEAKAGDRLAIDPVKAHLRRREGEILEVLRDAGGVRYRVRWDDGHESTFSPSGGVTIQPAGAGRTGRTGRRIQRWSRRVVAFAVFGLAAVSGVLSLVFLFSSCVLTGVTKVIAPGETRVTIPDSGTYTINYEYETVVNGRRFNTLQLIPSLRLELISTTSDAHIPIHESPHVELKTPFTKSWSMAEFTVDRPGTYVLISQYPSGETKTEEVVLAIARGDVATVWKSIIGLIGGVVLLFVGMALAGSSLNYPD